MKRVRTLAAVAILAALAATGCGRKGMPLPPEIRVADPTRDLSLAQDGTQAFLEWSFPQMTTAGGPLPDLEGIEVWRVELPVAQEPRGTTARDRQLRVNLLKARGEVITLLKDEGLALASRGAKLVVTDDLTHRLDGEATTGQVLLYAVRSVCCRGRHSDFSNIVRLVPAPAPEPPQNFEVTTGRDGLELKWTTGGSQAVRVERSGDGESWIDAAAGPVLVSPWVDRNAAQGETWSYRLRSVTMGAGGTVVQIGLSGPIVHVDYPDEYPPEPPLALVCLPEGGRVRLRWRRGDDAAGHRIQRSGGGESKVLAHDLSDVSYVDEGPPTGTITYYVRSVDAAGNRSEPVSCATVVEASQ